MFRDLYLRRHRNRGVRLAEQAARKLDQLVGCADEAERERLRREYDRLADRAQVWIALQSLKMFGGAQREAGISGAQHARDARSAAKAKRKKLAVARVRELRRAHPTMSVNAAVLRVGKALEIPPRTLHRWVAEAAW